MIYILLYSLFISVMSLITLVFFAIDKKSSFGQSSIRIPEIVLLSLTGLGGAIGAIIGMYVLRHKTDFVTKYHFAITTWLSAIVQVLILVAFIIM